MSRLNRVKFATLGLGVGVSVFIQAPAFAQISLGLDAGLTPNAICLGSTNGTTVFVAASDDCATSTGGVNAPELQIGPDSSYALFNATTGASTFTGTVTAQNDAFFNGTTRFTDVVSFTGPNATFATPTTFTFPATFQAATTFNGTTNFTAGMTTTNITNSGTINSTNVNVTGSLTAAPGTTINFGGVNRVQGVAAGVDPLDAVNVAQLNAATAGFATGITALQTSVAALEAESQYIAINSAGPPAAATGVDAIAIGEAAVASADNAIAIGRTSTASGLNAIAIGVNAVATGSVAVGAGASAAAGGAAFGDLAVATGGNSVAAGTEAVANNLAASAFGYQAVASGTASTALGHNSDATALGATAVGVSAQATQSSTTAVGRIANASATGSTALGNNAQASAANSVALGQNSVANQADTVSVGASGSERRIVNVAAGTSATDAVNLSQLNALGTSLGSQIDILSGSIDTLFELRGRDRRDMKQGVAAAMAIAPAPMPSAPGKVAYTINGATFRGEYAVGGSLQYRLNTEAPMAVSFGVSHSGGKNTGVRVGVAGEF